MKQAALDMFKCFLGRGGSLGQSLLCPALSLAENPKWKTKSEVYPSCL